MKKMFALLLSCLMLFGLLAGCTTAPEPSVSPSAGTETAEPGETAAAETYTVGMSIQDLSNPTWAGQIDAIKGEMDAMGWTFSAMQNDNDSSKILTQIENFIQSGADFIIIQNKEDTLPKDTIVAAQEAGVCFIGDGGGFSYANINYTNDNYAAGMFGGEVCGNWLNETFGEDYVAKIAVFEYPQSSAVMDRVNGQIDGLKSVHPNFEIVARAQPMSQAEAMTDTENLLTANPEIECIFAWGDVFGLGALETVRAMGYDEDKFCIIGIDGTLEAVNEIIAGSAFRQTTSLGSPKQQGLAMVDILKAYIAGTHEEHYYSPNINVDISNAQDYKDEYLTD